MFNTAIIKKKSKDKKNETKKVIPSGLKGMEDYDKGKFPSSDEIKGPYIKGTAKIENKPLKGIDMDALKGPSLKGIDMKKLQGDAGLDIDLKMISAKKKSPKEDINAVDEDGVRFKVDKDSEGRWSESAVTAKERYLNKIKSRKK